MSITAKTGVILVIILFFVVIGWFTFSKPVADVTNNTDETEQIPVVTPTPTPEPPVTAGTGLSDEKDLSTEAINSDIDAVSQQFDKINTDAVNADAGLKSANEIK